MNARIRIISLTMGLVMMLSLVAPVAAQAPTFPGRAAQSRWAQAVGAQPIAGDTHQGPDIEPSLPSDGSVDAGSAEVKAPPRPITVKIEGFVTRTYDTVPGELFVEDMTILVVESTLVSPESYVPIVGDYVEVTAVLDGETWTATYIRRSGDFYAPTEFRGMIESFPGTPDYVGKWSIGGINVEVDNRSAVTDTPVVGHYAQVQGWLQENRTVRATLVTILDPVAEALKFEYEGIIEATTRTTPGVWRIGGYDGLVTQDTVIKGVPEVGSTAQVQGHETATGGRIFDRIQVRDHQVQLRIEGPIERITQDYWIVNDQVIEVFDTTFIDESRARAAVGRWAEVVANQEGIFLRALRIRIERPE